MTPLHTLLNPTPAQLDEFGTSVAASGNLVVVGVPFDDAGAANSGAAYIYDATTGALLHTLLNPTPAEWDEFGTSVAVNGNLVVVGVRADDAGAANSGAAYIYDATTGALLHTLLNPTPAEWDEFGTSVAVNGNLVVVGAPWDSGAANSGAAYIYDATTGALLHTLFRPTPVGWEEFGTSVAVNGNLVVVGAPSDDAGIEDSGAAYIYDATTGALLHTLLKPTPAVGDRFGTNVAASGNLIVVGVPADGAGAQGSGAAYIYDATTGTLLHTLLNPTPAAWDGFGTSVAVDGNLVVVGVPLDDTGAANSGAAYIYDATTGALLHTLLSPTPAAEGRFGTSVAASGNLVVVGVPSDAAGAANSGAAYIYAAPVDQTGTVTGFLNTTSFGAPLSQATYLASGATTTTFGLPWGGFVEGPRTFDAVGLDNAAVFGGAVAHAALTAQAEGWSTSALGIPRARQTFPVSGWMTTTLGSPRVGSQHFADGFSSTVVIPPSALPTAPPPTQNWVLSAQGGSTTTFGSATAPAAVAVQVSGWSATRLGAPAGHQAATTTGWQTLNFGTANGVVRATALGFRTTQFGSGRSNVGRLTSAALPATHFGSRAIARHGRNLLTHHAEGFVVPPHIGSASASPVYRARHHPPSVRFGRATVRRVPIC